ncbi:hypothetical protein [Seongchinamella sediminis]|uniref:hypothetical protein n=1 Tax=Seongchinamella sediminis TaxID=2283635 RepID=UPI0010588775|nr:hypothetical protein [Seongchinamella sediminis]
MWFDKGKLWLGRHKVLDVFVVIEKSEVERKADYNIDAFYLDDLEFQKCKRDFLRDRIVSVARSEIPENLDTFTKEYWRKKHQAIEANHSAHLKKLGLASTGTRPRSKQHPIRVTHCWSCTRDLDSTIDLECCSCGWILCRCGACGCGYKKIL